MSDQTDDASSHQVKMRKTSPESNHAPMTDGCDYPLKWSSHSTGVARDEASFFAGWCAARQKFVAALRHDFVDSSISIKECEDVFNSLTYIFCGANPFQQCGRLILQRCPCCMRNLGFAGFCTRSLSPLLLAL
jgi:hypothetical protein